MSCKKDIFKETLLEVIADDQEMTIDYLRKGLVTSCFSTAKEPLAHCVSQYMGNMHYVLVASPEFKKKYFSNTQHKKNLLKAPSVVFDKNDYLNKHYLSKFFDIEETPENISMMPSVQGFKRFALHGYAYALIPEIDVRDEVTKGKLINLFPSKIWKMPVYFHVWEVHLNEHKKFFDNFIKQVKAQLS